MFESKNRKLSNQNGKVEFGIIEAEIRIEATQLTKRIVTALLLTQRRLPVLHLNCGEHERFINSIHMGSLAVIY